MSTPHIKAYSYIRFSSPAQAAGDSYDRQHRLAAAYCEAKKLELVSDTDYTFFDRAKSAFTGKNVGATGELRRFLNEVEGGVIKPGSVLIVESLDRLSRQHLRKALPPLHGLAECRYHCSLAERQPRLTKDLDQFALFQSIMEMARSHSESADKSKRVQKAWQEKQDDARESGKPLGKTKPAWLDLTGDPDKPYAINDKADVVRRIFQLTLDGYGKATVARMLNEENIPAFKGGTWGMSSID